MFNLGYRLARGYKGAKVELYVRTFSFLFFLLLVFYNFAFGAWKHGTPQDLSSTSSPSFVSVTITMGSVSSATGLTITGSGTSQKAIDISGAGISGTTEYFFYGDADNFWRGDSYMRLGGELNVRDISLSSGGYLYTAGVADLNLDPSENVGGGENMISNLIAGAGQAHLFGTKTKIGTWGDDGVSNGTSTITDVGGAAHGLSLAAGDLVHITAATTGADRGFYRIVSDDGTSVVLDRSLAGSDTDLNVVFYKDVIAIFATDGTNGQLIQSYSHQDKPLQIGGDVLAATGHSLGAEDVLFGGVIEFKKKAHFDGLTNFTQTTALGSVLAVNGNIPAGGTATQAGWITVEVGGVTKYVPYWE